jgi:aldehyde:ferredoxin oxidoreductase
MNANTGKVIRLDLNAGAVSIEMLPEDNYRKFVGGSGLAAKYFWDKADFNADALSPEAMLIFMNGPFSGLKLSGASRNSVAGRSPLTGHWADSSCGGYFAPELRFAGYDGIVLTGKSPKPSVLLIEDDKISIVEGTEYWGKGIEEVNKELKNKYGKTCRRTS